MTHGRPCQHEAVKQGDGEADVDAIFHYAPDPAGHPELRTQIALYVARSRAVRCLPEQVLVVNGSQQALDLCARVLLEPGDVIAVEDPGYTGARDLFRAHDAALSPTPVDRDGLVVGALHPKARVAYVTPSHQFPTGVSMSLARRLALLDWARRAGAVIIEDDYDSEYRYNGAPLPALQSLASGIPVIYVGTFSRVMFPGLRLGYVILPPALVEAFQRAKWLTDRHTPMLEQAALADFLAEGHLGRHVRRMRQLYQRRRAALVESLARGFGDRVTLFGDEAGMHLMVGLAGWAVPGELLSNGVRLASARKYYATPSRANEFVIGFSAIGERTIREGVRRLAAVL